MSQAEEEVHQDSAGKALVPLGQGQGASTWGDLRPAFHWLRGRRPVLAAAIVLVLAQVIWRAQFLNRMYFFRDDFFNQDLAKESSFNWRYLTYIGSGHLMIGERAITWVLTRLSFYNWGLAAVVSLAFVAVAGLAAFRVLRILFGERPAILVPLAIYLLTPLTVADLGWWTAALESVPLQLAMFMALGSHLLYVRTGRARHLAAAFAWVAFGLIFFEKGIVLPVLLFAVTSAFAANGLSWRSGARRVLVRYWRAWLGYAILLCGYVALLAVSLRTSSTSPLASTSLGDAGTFSWNLVKDTLLPGALGGPWQWLPLPGSWYALAGTPSLLSWLCLLVAVAIIGASIVRRPIAWRAWAILAMWVLLADMLPVIISRLNWYPALLALDTRYVADAAPVLAICTGLAFLPLAEQAATAGVSPAGRRAAGRSQLGALGERRLRAAAAVLFTVFVIGSIGSTQAYESTTTGFGSLSFIANARLALRLAPRGTTVVDSAVPQDVTYLATDARASRVIGDMTLGGPSRLRWITTPDGTFDHLMMFGTDGRLHLAQMYAVGSPLRRPGQNCWAVRGGQVRIPFATPTPPGTRVLRFGYLWYSRDRGLLSVDYGGVVKQVIVDPGLHGAYLPERGSARSVVISGFGSIRLCVGDAEAGILVPSATGPTIPPLYP